MTKPTASMIQQRAIRIDGEIDTSKRMVSASLSSEEPVQRGFGDEVLEHSADAIDMSRAGSGLPLLLNHDNRSLPVGRVDGIHLGNDKKLRGQFKFSDATQEARDAWALVEDGTLADVSISYRIMDYEQRGKSDTYNVTRWQPFEVSMVSVPADRTVGVGRSEELAIVPKTKEVPVMDKDKIVTEPNSSDILDDIKARNAAGYQLGAKAERERLTGIENAVALVSRSMPHLSAEIEQLAAVCREDESRNADTFNAAALALIGQGNTPLAQEGQAAARAIEPHTGITRNSVFHQGQDGVEKQARGMELALLEKSGIKVDAEKMEGNQFRGWSLLDIADTCLRNAGIDTRGMSREQIAKRAIAARAIEGGAANYATTDFPAVTENVATKLVFAGFEEAEVTWDQWCSVGSAPDFKSYSVPRLSAYSSLPVVAENAVYTEGTLLDEKESGAIVKYGSLLSLSWEAVINDDQSMFARNAGRMGEAAARTIDEGVYAYLLANGLMGDGIALFAAGHSNTGTNALDLSGVVATRVGMGRQTDENSVLLGILMRTVLVPLELQDAATELATADNLPIVFGADTAATVRANTVRGTFNVVATPRLTDANDWYGLARSGQAIEVVFLNGQRAPTLEQEMGWSYDTMNWKVRMPFDVIAVDWRGMYRNVVA